MVLDASDYGVRAMVSYIIPDDIQKAISHASQVYRLQ